MTAILPAYQEIGCFKDGLGGVLNNLENLSIAIATGECAHRLIAPAIPIDRDHPFRTIATHEVSGAMLFGLAAPLS
jgi:hypothetical protein